ncbi:MAG: uroporphyrinogen decarboxylase [Gemmatimonadaceae bacterium]
MTQQNPFMLAARGHPTTRTPVWFMRQAGRVLPEYRAVRDRWSLLEICAQPDLCAEVALQPVRRFGVDAAILFADIMLPLIGVGVQLDLVDEIGPVIRHPIATAADLCQLRPLEPEADVHMVLETVSILKAELGDRVPLIGFAGAPFTLAAYLIEGRPSRDFARTRAFMLGQPAVWHDLMQRLTRDMSAYLIAQLERGVDVVQLFDSWVGCLSPDDYREFVSPYTRQIFAAIAPWKRPTIHFGTNTWALLDEMKRDGASIMGVDWRVPLDCAWARLGHDVGIQGNLDPAVLLAPEHVIEARTRDVLCRAGGRPGHIFNLGHGLFPQTTTDSVHRVLDAVRQYDHERAAPRELASAS